MGRVEARQHCSVIAVASQVSLWWGCRATTLLWGKAATMQTKGGVAQQGACSSGMAATWHQDGSKEPKRSRIAPEQ